jgi:hypothetical protein
MKSEANTRWSPQEDTRIPLPDPSDINLIESMAKRAQELGLSRIVFAIDPSTGPWIPAVRQRLRSLNGSILTQLSIGILARVVDEDGGLDLHGVTTRLERIYITMDRLPMFGELCSPLALREAFEEGRNSALGIIRKSVEVLLRTIEQNPGAVICDPFAILRATGLSEDWVSDAALEALAEKARIHGCGFQVNEWQRGPRPGTVRAFADKGAEILFGTGSQDVDGVGSYDYIRSLLRKVPHAARSAAPDLAIAG